MLIPVLVALFVCCGLIAVLAVSTQVNPQELGIQVGLPFTFARNDSLVPGDPTKGAPPAPGGSQPGGAGGAPQFSAATALPRPTRPPTATPVPADVEGVRITDAKIGDQQVMNTDGKTFVTRLTFAIGAAHFRGLWGELQGDPSGTHYYPSGCAGMGCTFAVALPCSISTRAKMTFHSGGFWRYTSFTLVKPPGCGN